MFRFAGGAGDDGIHGTARFRGNIFDAETIDDVSDGIGAAFTERHIIFFCTAFVAVSDDLDGGDVAARFQAASVFFDGCFGIGADGGFVEVEISDARLADGGIDAFFIFADLSIWAILIDEAFGFGDATVIFAQIVSGAIFGDGFRVAFRAAAAVAAFLTGGAVNAGIGVAITVDSLTGAAVANVAFVAFALAMIVITAFGAFGIKAVFIGRFAAFIRRTIRIFVAFGVGRGATGSQNHCQASQC